jgi:hypothetical protein
MSFDGAFAMAVFLGAAWFGLLEKLIAQTREQPASAELLPAAFAHWLVLLYFLLAGAIVYGRGLASLARKPAWLAAMESLFLYTWPAALFVALIGFVGVKLVDFADGKWVVLAFVPLAWWFVGKARVPKAWPWVMIVIGAFFPYLLFMSWICASAEITTDKSTYLPGESVVVTVRTEGYLLNPSIKKVELAAGAFPSYQNKGNSGPGFLRVALPIKSDASVDDPTTRQSYIEVVTQPQAFPKTRSQYHLITVALR